MITALVNNAGVLERQCRVEGNDAARLGAAGEYVDYAASKGAVDTLTAGLSREVAAEGIRVNAVRPAFIYAGMHADGGEPGRVDRLKASLPMQRGGQPEEVAEAILWLLSDEASYATGSFIELAGGKQRLLSAPRRVGHRLISVTTARFMRASVQQNAAMTGWQ